MDGQNEFQIRISDRDVLKLIEKLIHDGMVFPPVKSNENLLGMIHL